MRTPLRIFGTIFLLLSLTIVTMPGVYAISPSGSEPQTISFPAADSEAKVSALLSLQVEAKLRCQQVQLTTGELSMMQARGMNMEDLETQRVFIHLAQEPTVKQLDGLESMGIIPYPDSWIPPVGEFPTGFIVADMPVDKLGALAGIDYVAQLDTAEQLLEPQNDQAAIAINADDVWGSGYDGSGVRIAVLDSGLDTSHPDIPAPVASKDYSAWPVLDDAIANSVTGHGTHVAGSALGRGTQSSGAASEYKGMAPDADLIFLKIGNDTTGNASLDAMTNAIKAAVDTYEADIITMSYGGWGDYHDGTRQTSQAVDYAFSQGAVVFISAGNEAASGEHYSGTVDAYSSTGFIQVDVSGSTGANAGFGFNLVWFDGLAENNDLVLEYYDSTQTAMGDIWAGDQEESWKGTEHELSGYGPEAGWYYYLPLGNPTYYLKVTNNSENQQFFHIYFEGIASSGASVEFNDADPFYTLGSPADAEKAIAVGAYTSRKNWTAYDGVIYHFINPELTVGTMAYFSSRGPRVDSGAPQKPNLVAPGSAIISVRDQDVYTWPGGASAYFVDNDGLNLDGSGPADYYVMHGTSMAAPIAAGAAALLLEANPELKGHPADVRNLLQSTASSVDANDNIDGYGLLDIQAAIDATASEFEADWLFMVYLDADNNLESAGIDDFNEMETAGSTDDVKIVVQMDRAERDYADDTTNGNWTGAKRFYVTQDTDQSIINSPVIEDLGEVNMGDPAVLQSFIEWAVANYPAQHYALVLWNHGSGWREREGSGETVKSICVDDESGDELTMTELRSALNAANLNTGKTLDIVGFDACLMQMAEVAYQVMGSASRPLVDITVGSEETEPGDGWDYADTLVALTADPTMTPAGLVTQIVNDYIDSYSSSWDITQSGVDLDYMEALATAIDSFAIAMTNATGDWTAISTARSSAQEYYYYYYIDLYHFAQLVNQDATISQTVRDAAGDVMTAVTNAVIAEGHTASVGDSHGLSIYYPETSYDYFTAYETDVLFTTDTHWDDFLYAILFTTPSVPDITVSPTSFDVALEPNTTEDYTLTISNDGTGDLTYDISDQEASGGTEPTGTEDSPATLKEEMGSRSPDLTLVNTEYDMAISVEDVTSSDGVGRYTEATADEMLLLYGYPYAWSSYMTVQLDGSDYYQDYSVMDSYVTQLPTADGNSITTQWTLPTNVGVSLRLTLQQDTTKYLATITNNDSASHEAKIRFLFDTMLAYNDGAPFIVPGVGNVTTEQEYNNPVFDYWQATDSLVTPTLTSNCTFTTGNKPYKVQFAYWPDIYYIPFDYTATIGQSITGDTAVGMYWNLGTLSAGESQNVIFYYGTTDAIIGTPEVSIVTLFTDEDSYLPEEDVTIYVDVGNGGDAVLEDGVVTINVEDPEEVLVFYDTSAITVEAGEVASCNFTYSLLADAVLGEYTITAKVYDSEATLLDEATNTFTVGGADCSWLSESPVSGTVAAGNSDPITVTIDTTGLTEGTYNAEIIIASNDPDEASVTVPVTLQVVAAELPTVTSVSPDSGEQGATLEVTIGGTNLTGAMAVGFGDGITVDSFTVVSAAEITASISIDTTATLGLRDVSVTTSAGMGTLTDGFTVVAVGAVTVSVDAPDTAAPDSDFTANIDISQVTELDSGNYDITFDPLVLQLDDVTSGLIGSTTIPVDMYNEMSPGTYRVVQNVPGLTGLSGSGYLAILHFRVIGSEGDSSAITLSNGTLSDAQAVEIEATWVGDSVSITSALAGDANGDGVVNALDITKVERIIVGLDAETPGADANGDGVVNALDITKLERIIVGLD
jgi:subtilisin family serine protease